MSMNEGSIIVQADDFLATKFDYLVLGGGTAGLVVASRLAEDPRVTVGVLEAGKDRRNDPVVDTPQRMSQMMEDPNYDWTFYTAPQEYNKGRKHHVVRGRMLGGSSGVNAMMYVRGSESDYDSWAKLLGDDGWNAKSMMKYMKKHETLEDMSDAITDRSTYKYRADFHGTSGPIRTSFNESKMPIEDAFIQTCNESIAQSAPVDAWSGSHIGFTAGLGTISREPGKRGKRSYAVNYLDNKSSKNLKILCEAYVNRVNLDGSKATGANFTFNGKSYDIDAAREVIVCGGTINTPQIVELSGIGDPNVLEKAGVELKVENKGVGANTQDHSLTSLGVELQPGVFSIDLLKTQPDIAQAMGAEYMKSGTGFLSNVFATTGFMPFKALVSEAEFKETIRSLSVIKPTSDFHRQQLEEVTRELSSETSANVQIAFFPLTYPVNMVAEHQGAGTRMHQPTSSDPVGITFVVCCAYPASRGSIHITNSDPTTPPEIQPNYGKEYADQMVLAACLRWADRVRSSSPLSTYLTGKRTFPPANEDLTDLSVGRKAVEEAILGEWHICGSMAMGDALDSRLKVKGVQNLRVADASAFPGNISGNIVSTVYALAEKAADMIKEDWL